MFLKEYLAYEKNNDTSDHNCRQEYEMLCKIDFFPTKAQKTLTLHQDDFIDHIDYLNFLCQHCFIRAVGVSVTHVTDELVECLTSDINCVVHIINGVTFNEERMNSNYDAYKDDMLAYVKDHDPVSGITSIMFLTTTEYIGKFAFVFCNSLETVEIYETDNEKISSVGCYYTAFFANAKLKYFNFYLTSERGYGNSYYFKYCISLKDVYLYPTDEGYINLNWLESSENINSIPVSNTPLRAHETKANRE